VLNHHRGGTKRIFFYLSYEALPMKSTAIRKKFKAVLENPEKKIDAAFVSIPFDVEEVFGTRGHIKVKVLFDGQPYRGILADMGTGCHVILVRKDVRQAIGKKVGDTITVELEPDPCPMN